MLHALFAIMAFQFFGGLVVSTLGVNFPGPLCGMLLLLFYRHIASDGWVELDKTAFALVDHLGLLFVPAGVAVFTFGDEMASNWLPIAAAIVVSTAFAIGAAGLIANRTTQGRSLTQLETALPRPDRNDH